MPKNKEAFDYNAVKKRLKAEGPQTLYLLWGEEDYLKEQYIEEVLHIAFPSDDREFNYHLIDCGRELDIDAISSAVDAMPFMSERSVVLVRDADLNSIVDSDYDKLNSTVSDLPDYCTLIFSQHPSFTPDKRLKAIKTILKYGQEIQFYASGHTSLISWIQRHFQEFGKTIDNATAEYLIFYSGDLMTRLLPEIEKIAAYTTQNVITKQDIDVAATRIPEASVFLITDAISEKDKNKAAKILSDLLSAKDNEPIALLALIGNQMRRLYGAKLSAQYHLGQEYLETTCGMKGWLADRLMRSSKAFTLDSLRHYVSLCAEADFAMKSTSVDDSEILTDLLMRICSGEII